MRLHRIQSAARAPLAPQTRRGQSLVEFALILMPLMFLILLGIIQFGFIFNTYMTMTNATREARARRDDLRLRPDAARRPRTTWPATSAIKTPLLSSMNLLSQDVAALHDGQRPGRRAALTFTNGDLVVTYVVPAGITDTDSRVGQQVTVTRDLPPGPHRPAHRELPAEGCRRPAGADRRSHDGHQLMTRRTAAGGEAAARPNGQRGQVLVVFALASSRCSPRPGWPSTSGGSTASGASSRTPPTPVPSPRPTP